MQKFYCYVDETGQDTQGKFFLVSIVIAHPDHDDAIKLLEGIETETKKGRVKWAKATTDRRLAYITAVLQQDVFKGRLYYGVHHDSTKYQEMTVATAAYAIEAHARAPYKVTVIIDGLEKTLYRTYTSMFRRYGANPEKVRGGNEDKDALLRLADALCGFVRDAIEGKPKFRALLDKAIVDGYVTDLGLEDKGDK